MAMCGCGMEKRCMCFRSIGFNVTKVHRNFNYQILVHINTTFYSYCILNISKFDFKN